MSAEKIQMEQDSRERVAFDLMVTISLKEEIENKDRKYYLALYRQCYKAAFGHHLQHILEDEPPPK